jgi:seryl-tRNA synthetase
MISYGLDFLRKKGYKKIQPPFFMNKDQMAKTAQLDQFDEELYKVRLYNFGFELLVIW